MQAAAPSPSPHLEVTFPHSRSFPLRSVLLTPKLYPWHERGSVVGVGYSGGTRGQCKLNIEVWQSQISYTGWHTIQYILKAG